MNEKRTITIVSLLLFTGLVLVVLGIIRLSFFKESIIHLLYVIIGSVLIVLGTVITRIYRVPLSKIIQ